MNNIVVMEEEPYFPEKKVKQLVEQFENSSSVLSHGKGLTFDLSIFLIYKKSWNKKFKNVEFLNNES